MDSIYKQIVMNIIKSAEILELCFRFRSSSSFVESARELGEGGVLDGDVVVVSAINQSMKKSPYIRYDKGSPEHGGPVSGGGGPPA